MRVAGGHARQHLVHEPLQGVNGGRQRVGCAPADRRWRQVVATVFPHGTPPTTTRPPAPSPHGAGRACEHTRAHARMHTLACRSSMPCPRFMSMNAFRSISSSSAARGQPAREEVGIGETVSSHRRARSRRRQDRCTQAPLRWDSRATHRTPGMGCHLGSQTRPPVCRRQGRRGEGGGRTTKRVTVVRTRPMSAHTHPGREGMSVRWRQRRWLGLHPTPKMKRTKKREGEGDVRDDVGVRQLLQHADFPHGGGRHAVHPRVAADFLQRNVLPGHEVGGCAHGQGEPGGGGDNTQRKPPTCHNQKMAMCGGRAHDAQPRPRQPGHRIAHPL